METVNTTQITVEATVNAPIEKVWKYWTEPQHVKKWNNASDDWHTTRAENGWSIHPTSSRNDCRSRSAQPS